MTDYKRLTKKGKYGYVIEPYAQCAGDLKMVVDRLAQLENQIENGELLTPEEHLKRCKELTDKMCADCVNNVDNTAKRVLAHCQELMNEACDKCEYKKKAERSERE